MFHGVALGAQIQVDKAMNSSSPQTKVWALCDVIVNGVLSLYDH